MYYKNNKYPTVSYFEKEAKKILEKYGNKISPRLFRWNLKITKEDLYYWKKNKPNLYKIYYYYFDFVLANVEQNILFSPDKAFGSIFILKAYDTFYREAESNENKPITINFDTKERKSKIAKK